MNGPLQIGITGGIGSGKSLICRVFTVLGAPVYDADSNARNLMNESPTLKEGIIDLFGKESYVDDGLNRAYIADIVFRQPELLQKLNALVHPAVAADFESWVTSHSGEAYVIEEAALLFETGGYRKFDQMILVTAPVDVRISRVRKRDSHRSEADIRAIIEKQWPDEKKMELADVVFRNDGSEMLLPRIVELHHRWVQS